MYVVRVLAGVSVLVRALFVFVCAHACVSVFDFSVVVCVARRPELNIVQWRTCEPHLCCHILFLRARFERYPSSIIAWHKKRMGLVSDASVANTRGQGRGRKGKSYGGTAQQGLVQQKEL